MATMLELDDLPHEVATPVPPGLRTLGDVLIARASATPERPACYQKVGEAEARRWQKLTWQGLLERSQSVAKGLVSQGLEPGDSVAILGPTQPDWAAYDFGGQLAGAITVGVYPRQAADQVRYLLEHSESKVIFVADDEEMATTLEAASGLESLQAIVAWNETLAGRWRDRDPRVLGPASFVGEPLDMSEVERRQAALDPEDTAILIYTSGTTGPPKGAMISHRNILTLCEKIPGVFPYFQDDMVMAFLPMAHATERCLSFYGRVSVGIPAAYATSVGSVIEELQEVRPTVFGSVPRIFEKLYDRVQGEVAKSSPVKQAIFHWAEGASRKRLHRQLEGRTVGPLLELQHKAAMALVFSKIQARFGGRVRACITGAAPIAKEILEFLWSLEMPVLEAYGMTESTVVTHINRFDSFRLGTVGQPVPTLECKIADDGEILIRGPLVFKGYLKNPDATAEAVVDGWLHSGDIGTIDDEGFLRITDRKKHLIITAGGKNVAPANIERAIKNQSPLISQVHAHGDRRKFICALIAPSPLETLAWGRQEGLLDAETVKTLESELLANPSARSPALGAAMAKVVASRDFQRLFRAPVQRGNEDLARVERVRKFFLLDRDFSQEGGELTPTMKMKRKAIEEKYQDLFDKVYDEPEFAMEAESAT